MSVRDDITQHIRAAMKARDRDRLRVLRMLLSELKVAETSGSDFDELDVVKSYAKRLRKNAEEYEELNLPEKAREAREELAVAEEFLPEQMSRQQISQLVEDLIERHDYGAGDLGQIMKRIMSEYGDRVDGGVANEIVRQKLSETQ